MSLSYRRMLVGVAAAVTLVACGGAGESGSPTTDEPAPPQPPAEEDGFDAERSQELAEAYLGVAEEQVEETVMVRIMRRGEESFAGTMDLRPGRFNLELDEDEEGVYRVSRVVVERDDGGPLVVE